MKKFIFSLILVTQILSFSGLPAILPGQKSANTGQPISLPKPNPDYFDNSLSPEQESNIKTTPISAFNEESPCQKRRKRKAQNTIKTIGLLDLDLPIEKKNVVEDDNSSSVLFPDTPKSPKNKHDYIQNVLDSILEPFIIFAGGNGNATSPVVKLVRTLLAIDDKEQNLIFNGNPLSGKKSVKPVNKKTALFFINALLKFVEIREMKSGKKLIEFNAGYLKSFLNNTESELTVDGKKVKLDFFIKKFLKPKNGKLAFVKKPLITLADIVEKSLKVLNSVNNSEYELNIIISVFYKLELIYDKLIGEFKSDIAKIIDERDSILFTNLSKDGVCSLYSKQEECVNRISFFKKGLRDIIANPIVESLLRIDNTRAIEIEDSEFIEELKKSVVQINNDIDGLLDSHSEYGRINVILSLITGLFVKAKNCHDEDDLSEIQLIMTSLFDKIFLKIYDGILYQDNETHTKFISNKYLPLLASAYRVASCLCYSEKYFNNLKEFIVIAFEHISDPVLTIKNGKTKIQGGHFLFKNEFIKNGDSFEFRNKYLTNDKDEAVEKDGTKYLVDSFKILHEHEAENTFIGYWIIKKERTDKIVGYKISTVCVVDSRENFYKFVNEVINHSKQCVGKNVCISKVGNLRLKVAFSDIAKLRDLKDDIKIESILTLFPIIYEKLYNKNIKKINMIDPNKNINILNNKTITDFPICSVTEFSSKDFSKEEKHLFDCEKIGYEDYYSKQKGLGFLYYSNSGNYIRFYLPVSEYNFVKTRKDFVPLIEYI